MGNILRVLVAVGLLGVPLVVISALPRVFELASASPVSTSATRAAVLLTPTLSLLDPTPASARKYVAFDETPPPTLSAPPARANVVVTPSPVTTGERVVVGNTGGRGAVLRAEPVSGPAVAALREQQVLDVIERRTVPGGGEWVHVRTSNGVEGWVTAVVALPTR